MRNAVDTPAKTTQEVKTTHTMMDKKDSSSEELTMSTVEKMKEELMKTMTELEATLVTNIFKKFTTEATEEDKMNGVVGVNLPMYMNWRKFKITNRFVCSSN